MMVKPRTKEQLKLMRKSGAISAFAMKQVLKAVKPGANLKTLDAIAEEAIVRKGAKPSFMTVPGYKWTTCLTINEEVVHGIPRDIVLKEGDKLSIDLGAVYKGWHTDTAWSLMVGGSKSEFLDCGEKAMWDGISKAVAGNTIGDISNAIQTEIESKGYSVVRTLVGHGVGRQLHEEPEVPGIGERGMGLLLEKGVTLAIESIYAKGDHEVVLANDGWTIVSKDGSLGGLFEMTVVVGDKKPKVLTDWRKV